MFYCQEDHGRRRHQEDKEDSARGVPYILGFLYFGYWVSGMCKWVCIYIGIGSLEASVEHVHFGLELGPEFRADLAVLFCSLGRISISTSG